MLDEFAQSIVPCANVPVLPALLGPCVAIFCILLSDFLLTYPTALAAASAFCFSARAWYRRTPVTDHDPPFAPRLLDGILLFSNQSTISFQGLPCSRSW